MIGPKAQIEIIVHFFFVEVSQVFFEQADAGLSCKSLVENWHAQFGAVMKTDVVQISAARNYIFIVHYNHLRMNVDRSNCVKKLRLMNFPFMEIDL